MKFITYFSNLNTLAPARVLSVNENREGSGERNETIEGLLQNPLSFSLADISTLSEQVTAHNNSLTGKEQHLFNKLINFHLARLQKSGAVSTQSRTLFAIFRQPGLSQFLSANQRKQVETYLSQEAKDLEKFANEEPKNWKPAQAIRLARSYRFVRNRLNTANLKIDEKSRNTGDKLKIYAATLVEKTTLSNTDKLFLVELRRVFPHQSDWQNSSVAALVFGKAQTIEDDFKKIIADKGNVPADAQEYWDVLIPDAKDAATTTEPLKKFLARSAEVESLKAITEKDKDEDSELEDQQVPLLLSIEEYRFLKTLHNAEPSASVSVSAEATAAVSNAEAHKAEAESAHQALVQQREAEAQTLKAKNPADLKAHPNLTDELKSDYQQAWEAIATDVPAPAEGEEPPEPAPALAAYNVWKEKAIKAILDTNSELSEEAIAAKKADVDTAQADLEAAQKTEQELTSGLELYQNPAPAAEKLLNNHANYFNARFKSGRLLATDLDLLTHLEPSEQEALIGPEYRLTLDLVDDTRRGLADLLQTKTGVNIDDLQTLSAQDIAAVDKFLSYEAVMANLAETKLSGQSLSLLKTFETAERDSLLDARQLIGATVVNVREQIINGVTSAQARNSGAYNEFLTHYTRQHHALNKSSRVDEMLSFSEKIEKQKSSKIGDVYEHAHTKVDALFANAEEKQILEGLNQVLKTEISATSVLNAIQSAIGEETLIHNGSTADVNRWKNAIVNELQDKVILEHKDTAHLNILAEDLLAKLSQMKAGTVAKESLKFGVKQLEANDEDNLSVSDRLALAERTRLVYLEVRDIDEAFKSDLSRIKTGLEKTENVDALIENFFTAFKNNYLPRLETLQKALIAEFDLYFYPHSCAFAKTLNTAIGNSLAGLKLGVDNFKAQYQDPNVTISHTDDGFNKLIAAINNDVLPKFDLSDGTLAVTQENKLDGTLEQAAHTHKYVRDELGLLKPGGAEKAKKQYESKRRFYQTQTDYFKRNWEVSKNRLQKDLKKYNEEMFSAKHQMSKKQAYEIIKNNDSRAVDAQWMIDYFSGKNDSPYGQNTFEDWLNDYQNPETQPRALHFMKSFKEFDDLIGKDGENFAGEASEMGKFVKDYDANRPTLFFKKKYKLTLSWYSLSSIYNMVKQSWEAWGKRTERERDRMTAELGAKIWGDTFIGQEFSVEANKKETERVGNFKESYGDKDPDYLLNVLKNTPDIKQKDKARASIELLIEKGALRWDSSVLLELLNRLQDSVKFNIPGDIELYAQDPTELRGRIGQAVTAAWDRPTWEQWQSDLPSKYESKMKSFETEYKETIQKGGVEKYIVSTLEKWASGDVDPNFERARYEQFLYMAFENGEMNGPNDKRWFYLIKGLTPYMDALDDKSMWKKDGRIVPEGTPGAKARIWNYSDIQAWGRYFDGINGFSDPNMAQRSTQWFQETLVHTFDAKNRMDKIDHTKVDHDDMWNIPLLVDTTAVEKMFNTESNGKNKLTFEQSIQFIDGFQANMELQAKAFINLRNEYANTTGYAKERDRRLRQYGMMMKSYLIAINKLASNYQEGNQTEPASLAKEAWADDKKNKLDSNKKLIETASVTLTGVLEFKPYNLSSEGKKYSKSEKPDGEAALLKMLGSDSFSDPDSVERFIDKNYF